MERSARSSAIGLGLLLGALLTFALLAERRGNVPFPMIDLATGCSLLLAGALAVRNRRHRLTGVLLLFAGASWFVVTADLSGGLEDRLTYVHRALVVHALLITSGRATPVRIAVVVIAYAGSIDPGTAFSTTFIVGVGGATVTVLVADAARRRSTWQFAIPSTLGVALWTVSVGILLQHDILDPRVRSALYGLGLGLAALTISGSQMLLARANSPSTADIVRDGGPADVRIGFRASDEGEFEEVGGQPFAPRRDEATMRIQLGQDLGEAVVAFAGSAFDVARAERELTEGLRLLAANRLALQALRTQARDVAASERRIREADEHAESQIGLELDRFVVRRLNEALELIDEHDASTTDARGALLDVLAEIRALAAGLSPRALDSGIRAALASLAESQPMPVSTHLDDLRVHPDVALALYFAAAECMTNAVRHSSASRLQLWLRARGPDAELTVADDGTGGARLISGGGLAGLADRVESLGGHLAVRAGGGGGTVITVHLPLAIGRG